MNVKPFLWLRKYDDQVDIIKLSYQNLPQAIVGGTPGIVNIQNGPTIDDNDAVVTGHLLLTYYRKSIDAINSSIGEFDSSLSMWTHFMLKGTNFNPNHRNAAIVSEDISGAMVTDTRFESLNEVLQLTVSGMNGQPASYYLNYNNLTNKPTIPAAQIQSDWNQTTTTAKDYIKNKPTIPSPGTNIKSVGGGNLQGTSATYARSDHQHGISLATGDNNGQVKIAGTNVTVKGLGRAAYVSEIPTEWLGRSDFSKAGGLYEFDRLFIPSAMSNRLAFIDPQYVVVEQSADGGTTWTNINSDLTKRRLFSQLEETPVYVGGVNNTNTLPGQLTDTTLYQYQSRITIKNPSERYCKLNRFHCLKGGPHVCEVKIEYNTADNPNTWTTWVDWTEIVGWTEWNTISMGTSRKICWGGGSTVYHLRFIFRYKEITSTHITTPAQVGDIRMFDNKAWGQEAIYDLPYYWDTDANFLPAFGKHKKYHLGTINQAWKNIYGEKIYEDGTALVDKYAAKSTVNSLSSTVTSLNSLYTNQQASITTLDTNYNNQQTTLNQLDTTVNESLPLEAGSYITITPTVSNVTIAVDAVTSVTSGSNKLVTSGAVYTAIQNAITTALNTSV